MAFQVDNLNESHMLHMNSFLLTSKNDKSSRVHPSYPFDSIELCAVFVYGHDIERQVDIYHFSKKFMILFSINNFITTSLATILWIARRKIMSISQSEFSLAQLHILSVIFGGGNVRIQHRFERYFFSILMLASFFTVPLTLGEYLEEAYNFLNQQMSTFEELRQFNLSVYSTPPLRNHNNDVQEMLKYELIKCFIISF